MRRRIAFTCLAIAMIAIEACGLGIVGEPISGSSTGSPEGSTASDGPLGSSDGPPMTLDATADATLETGVDASAPFCATTSHRFCRDFDDGADAGGAPEISTNGSLVLDIDSFSHPYALSAKIGPTQPDNHALNFDPIPVVANAVRFEVELRVDASGGPGDSTHLFTLQDVASATYGVRLSVDGAGMLDAVTTHIAWVSIVPPAIVLKLGLVGASSVATSLHIDNAALD